MSFLTAAAGRDERQRDWIAHLHVPLGLVIGPILQPRVMAINLGWIFVVSFGTSLC